MTQKRRDRCIQIAQTLQGLRTGRSLHISFILKSNRILCYAVNNYQCQHLAHKFQEYLPSRVGGNYVAGRHSEANVCKSFLRKFGHLDVSGLTLFNVRLSKNGEPMLAKPCSNCQRVFVDPLNWKRVVFTK